MYAKLVVQGDNRGDLRELWLYLYEDTHQGAGQQWVKMQEENNHASEAVLCADFKHWMPLCISAENPTRGRIQITTDFIPAKTSSKQRFQGTWTRVFRLTVLKLMKGCSLCLSWQEQMIKIQVSQEWQSQPEATDPEAAIERQQVWADLAALLLLNHTLDDVWSYQCQGWAGLKGAITTLDVNNSLK